LRHPRPNDFVFDVAVLNLVCFGHLTRRANQAHIGIIADIVEPAPETAAGFSVSKLSARAVSICRNRFVEFSAICYEAAAVKVANRRSRSRAARPFIATVSGRRPPLQSRLDILQSTRTRTLVANDSIRKLILNAFSVRAAPCRFIRRRCVIKINT
jgi:hypothetical protein